MSQSSAKLRRNPYWVALRKKIFSRDSPAGRCKRRIISVGALSHAYRRRKNKEEKENID